MGAKEIDMKEQNNQDIDIESGEYNNILERLGYKSNLLIDPGEFSSE